MITKLINVVIFVFVVSKRRAKNVSLLQFSCTSRWRLVCLIGALSLPLLCSSCGERGPAKKQLHPAQGLVRFNGKPIAAASVSLHPKDTSWTERPGGTTRQDGVFKISTY